MSRSNGPHCSESSGTRAGVLEQRTEANHELALTVPCAFCGADVGTPCKTPAIESPGTLRYHTGRLVAARHEARRGPVHADPS